jgi:hypothetical protein
VPFGALIEEKKFSLGGLSLPSNFQRAISMKIEKIEYLFNGVK